MPPRFDFRRFFLLISLGLALAGYENAAAPRLKSKNKIMRIVITSQAPVAAHSTEYGAVWHPTQTCGLIPIRITAPPGTGSAGHGNFRGRHGRRGRRPVWIGTGDSDVMRMLFAWPATASRQR